MRYTIIFLIVFVFVQCNNIKDKAKQNEPNSAVQTKVTENRIDKDQYDSAMHNLIDLFQKPNERIPNEIILQTFKLDSITIKYGRYKTKQIHEFDNDVIGFELKYECSSGGICEKDLLILFKGNELTDRLETSHKYGDLGFTNELTVRISGQQIIQVETEIKNIELENGDIEEKVVKNDTIIKTIDLKTGKIN